jgi:Uma2 family endonuclease
MDRRPTACDGGTRLTIEAFERLSEDGPYRADLVRGRVVREPPAGSEHGSIGAGLAARIWACAREAGLGEVFAAETGFILFRDPPTVRAPDVAFVARERIPEAGLPRGFFPGAPDLAVEIVSPSNTPLEIREKVADFLAAGSRVIWVVEPRSRTITVHRPDRPPRTLAEDEELDGEEVVRGLNLRVRDVFP